MRKTAIILTALVLAFVCGDICHAQVQGSRPESLSDGMASLLEAVRMQRTGMKEKDRYVLMDAYEAYNRLESKDLPCKVIHSSSENALRNPVVQFEAAYCDSLIASNFQLVEMAPINHMRPMNAPAIMGHRIAAGESVTFSISARKGCQLLLVSDTGFPLEVSATAGGKPIDDIESLSEDDGTTHILLWWQPAGVPKVDVTVRNPGNRDADFMMAAN